MAATEVKKVENPTSFSSPCTDGKFLSQKVVMIGWAGTSWRKEHSGLVQGHLCYKRESVELTKVLYKSRVFLSFFLSKWGSQNFICYNLVTVWKRLRTTDVNQTTGLGRRVILQLRNWTGTQQN